MGTVDGNYAADKWHLQINIGVPDMDKEIKKEARKQYFKYFGIWFIVAGVLLFVWLGLMAGRMLVSSAERSNLEAPAERVFDYADVLTDEEENLLRAYIAKKEKQTQMDIVLVTISEDVESGSAGWTTDMMNRADDFYDDNLYGYNKVHGDGVLLLDNWYEGQEGSWFSAAGKAERRFSGSAGDRVVDAVYREIGKDTYKAYKAYVDTACNEMSGKGRTVIPGLIILVVPLVTAVIYACSKMSGKKAQDTTKTTEYVENNKPIVNQSRDDFLRKNVVTRHIQTNSGSSGGGHRSGGSSHVSRSGVRHSGAGRRR